MDAAIFIPTRNRPNSLGLLLQYLGKFYPSVRVVIADGSADEQKNRVKEVVSKTSNVDIQFFDFPTTTPLHHRCIETLESIDDELVVTCADDDYPLVDVLNKGVEILKQKEDVNVVVPASVVFRALDDSDVDARLILARDYLQDSVEQRLKRYGQMHHYTYYGATRRGYLIDKYKYFDDRFSIGYGDFFNVFYDLCKGKLKALPKIGYLRTVIASHSKLHAEGTLYGAYNFKSLLESMKSLLDEKNSSCSIREIELICERSLGQFIGYRAHLNAVMQAVSQKIYTEASTRGQLESFHGLFKKGQDVRNAYIGQLRWVIDSLYNPTLAEDNVNEPKFYQSISEMA